jgi:hypothetical protein
MGLSARDFGCEGGKTEGIEGEVEGEGEGWQVGSAGQSCVFFYSFVKYGRDISR